MVSSTRPTDATFTPDPRDPNSGTMQVGQLSSRLPNDGGFRPDDVCRVMTELWVEYVADHPEVFRCLAGRHEKSRPVVSQAHRELKGRGTEALTMTQGTPLLRLSSAGSHVPVHRRQRMG